MNAAGSSNVRARFGAWLPWVARRACFPLLLIAAAVIAPACNGSSPALTTAAGGTAGAGGDPVSVLGAAGVSRGGVLRVGSLPVLNLDPHFATNSADVLLSRQVYDYLLVLDVANRPTPALASRWASKDGRVWTFDLRQGIRFHDGSDLTAEDVVYTFDRLRDPRVGAPTVGLYSNIVAVRASGPYQVTFTLKEPDPEFPVDAADYHAAILSKGVSDPAKLCIGSGPFRLRSYLAQDRAVLVRNPEYWVAGADGRRLPYLDEIHFLFSNDPGVQVTALKRGELDFLPGLSGDSAAQVGADPKLKLITSLSNAHWVIHMRADEGHPGEDPLVRLALRLATDGAALATAVRPGLAEPGNGTPVGPLYRDYYLDREPAPDLDRARRLLLRAGKANLELTLFTHDHLDAPRIAAEWKRQLAKVGVVVDVRIVPADVYNSSGGELSWLWVDFGLTDWDTRPTPLYYFPAGYCTGGRYNASRWSDSEFDQVVESIGKEIDDRKRAELYREAQEILLDRGPMIVPFVERVAAGLSKNVVGVMLASDWSRTSLSGARFAK